MIVRDDPVEETDGGIILAEMAQRIPVSGVVVHASGELKDMVGVRVYFRPYTEVEIPLGPEGDGPEVCFVHKGDVFMIEEVE
jgi:co-chaperonin GroES (HSP10)